MNDLSSGNDQPADPQPACEIASQCDSKPIPGSDGNRDAERVKEGRELAQATLNIVARGSRTKKADLSDANQVLVASQVNDALAELEPNFLKDLMKEKPETFFRVAGIVADQANERTRRQKVE